MWFMDCWNRLFAYANLVGLIEQSCRFAFCKWQNMSELGCRVHHWLCTWKCCSGLGTTFIQRFFVQDFYSVSFWWFISLILVLFNSTYINYFFVAGTAWFLYFYLFFLFFFSKVNLITSTLYDSNGSDEFDNWTVFSF